MHEPTAYWFIWVQDIAKVFFSWFVLFVADTVPQSISDNRLIRLQPGDGVHMLGELFNCVTVRHHW
jgi:hypothetical protein